VKRFLVLFCFLFTPLLLLSIVKADMDSQTTSGWIQFAPLIFWGVIGYLIFRKKSANKTPTDEIPSPMGSMSTFEINDWSAQQIDELVAALNSDGILHALSGSTLRVAEEDAEAVSIAIQIGNEFSTYNKYKNSLQNLDNNQSQNVRYDISKFHPYETSYLRERLSDAVIKFDITDGILSVPRSRELEADKAILESEQALKAIELEQSTAREIHSGRLAPSCEICGRSPAAQLDLRRQVGMVIVMKTYRSEMTLCESCAAEAYKQFQKSTAIKGWTGVKSALMNPIVLGTNTVNRNKHRKKLQEGK